MRYSGGCGQTWLCSAGTEHICGDHMESLVVDGEGVSLPCKVQSVMHCLLALGWEMKLKVAERLC